MSKSPNNSESAGKSFAAAETSEHDKRKLLKYSEALGTALNALCHIAQGESTEAEFAETVYKQIRKDLEKQ